MAKSKIGNAGGNEAGHIINAGVMTGTNVLGPFVIDIRNIDDIGFDVSWTGTPTGSFKVEVSNSHLPNPTLATTGTPIRAGKWTDVTALVTPAFTNPAGSAGNTYNGLAHTLSVMSAKFLRFSYTNASGAGVLDVWASGKALSG